MNRFSFDYLKEIYKGNNNIVPFVGHLKRNDKIDIECPVHGLFQQAVSSVLASIGCQKCYFDNKKGKHKYTTDTWIKKAEEIHNNFYDYSLSKYSGAASKIDIICPIHGLFSQAANLHISGHGCRKCSTDKMVKSRSYNQEKYIEAAILKHGNKYSYEKTVFTDIKSPVTIICPDHGEFTQIAYYHTAGNGCQKCGIENTTYKSAPEYEIIDYLKSLGITDIKHSSRTLGFELDIFLPEYNLAIEYNGLYWHSSDSVINDKKLSVYHLNKTQKCEDNGIKLFHIFENEWCDPIKKTIWKSMISNAIGKSIKIHARKCEIQEVTNVDAKEFCNNNHMQGGINSSICYGLFYEDKLVSVITLGKSRYLKNSCLEIYRFCNLLNTTVIGGFSKFIHFIRNRFSNDLVSYANRRWSSGNLYEKCGFILNNTSGPCYFYLDPNMNIYHRSTFTKKNILKKFPGSSGTEVSIMYDNKYRRIWDSGNKVYFMKDSNEK